MSGGNVREFQNKIYGHRKLRVEAKRLLLHIL
jgi:hypothetical protein